jgi:hypothetical protein
LHSTYIHTYIHTHTYTYTQGVIEQRNREEEEAFCIPPSLRTTTASSSTTPFGTAPHMLGAQTERVFVTSAQMRALGGGEGGGESRPNTAGHGRRQRPATAPAQGRGGGYMSPAQGRAFEQSGGGGKGFEGLVCVWGGGEWAKKRSPQTASVSAPGGLPLISRSLLPLY